MPCSALSGVALRSSSIQRCRSLTISERSAWMMPASLAASCSQCCTSGLSAWVSTNAGRRLRANGNSTSLTKEIELVVPSMSVRMARITAWSRYELSAVRCGLEAREALRDVVAGELRNPAGGGVEQADRDEVRLFAHVEPVAGAVRHADQVAAFAQHLENALADVQCEQAAAGDEETHLVLGMGVLVEEFGAERGAIRVVRIQADHVDGLVAFLAHQPVDIAAIGRDDFV